MTFAGTWWHVCQGNFRDGPIQSAPESCQGRHQHVTYQAYQQDTHLVILDQRASISLQTDTGAALLRSIPIHQTLLGASHARAATTSRCVQPSSILPRSYFSMVLDRNFDDLC